MSNIPIRSMTQSGTPASADLIVFDNGTMRKGTVGSMADAVRPVASQSEAQAGSDNAKTMTPLRVKQSIASEVGTTVQAYDADLSVWATKTAPSGAVVGTTDAQTLTNKTLTAPAINSPTGLVKADVGLSNVDNTSDANKPVSTAQGTAIALKADIASPTFTGTPAAPTAAPGTNTNQLATTAFVLANGGGGGVALPFKNIKTDYGAAGNGVQITGNVSITSGTAALTVSGASFAPGDVGKVISVPGAGTTGGTLVTTILSYTSATQVTLNTNASTTVSGTSQRVVYGTNDLTAINTAIAAINAGTVGRLYMPKGVYIANGTITTISGQGAIYGDGVGSTIIMNTSATGDIVTISGTMNVESLAIYSSVFPRTSGISLNLTGNSSYIHNVDVIYAYLGIQNTGVLNLLVNVNINMLTSRNVSAGSGGVLNSGTILSCFNVKMGSGTHTNADMAEFGFKVVVGELDITQCFVFLVNRGLQIAPGNGQTVLGVNVKGCWFDTTIGYGVDITPTHASAILSLVWISDTWIAPGSNGANGYGIVMDNTVGATLQKAWFSSNYVLSYTHNSGNGVYLKGANLGAYFSNCTIGGATQAFSVGVNAQANTGKFSFTGGAIAYNGTGVTIGAGCDYFTFNGVNEISSNGSPVSDSSTSVNGFFTGCPGYSGWKSFTPTIGASSGTPTGSVTGKYKLDGKTVNVTYSINLTGGTGAGDLTATLPFQAVTGNSFVGSGRDAAVGTALQASVLSAGTTIRISTTASNAYPATSGAILASITYEAA